MAVVVLIMTIFIWIVVGLWINHKRNWYKYEVDKDSRENRCFFTVLLSPIALIIVFFKEFLINPWNNN